MRGIICGHDYDIDGWRMFTSEPYEFDPDYADQDCAFYEFYGQKVCIHHGVVQAVRESFGECQHLGRIWFKDFREKA